VAGVIHVNAEEVVQADVAVADAVANNPALRRRSIRNFAAAAVAATCARLM
jgi:transcription initiation factor TFIIIB Brf1 subunit/transcription initiation factor TFIIB